MMRGMKNFTEEQKSMNAQLEQLYPWYRPTKTPNKSNVMSTYKQASRELTRLNKMVCKMEDVVQQADRFSERRTNELFERWSITAQSPVNVGVQGCMVMASVELLRVDMVHEKPISSVISQRKCTR